MKDELHGYTKAVSFVCLDKHNKNINDIESRGQRTHITARDESHAEQHDTVDCKQSKVFAQEHNVCRVQSWAVN